MTDFKRGDVVVIYEKASGYDGQTGIVIGPSSSWQGRLEVLTLTSGEESEPDTDPGHFRASDLRKVVVLDLNQPLEVARLLREDGYDSLANQIEAQTKPPRIPEPVAFDAAVTADTHQPATGRRRFVRVRAKAGGYSWVDHTGQHRPWAELLEPVLLRDGLPKVETDEDDLDW